MADFATTERDLARGISRMPLVLARIYEEDIDFDAGTNPNRAYRTSPKNADSSSDQ